MANLQGESTTSENQLRQRLGNHKRVSSYDHWYYLAYSAGSESSVEGVYIKDMTILNSVPERLVSGTMPTWLGSSQLAFTATTGVSLINIATRKITSLVKGAHHPKFRN